MTKPISKAELLTKIRHYVAEDAIGVTTLRGQNEGTRKVVLKFLKGLDLSSIPHRQGQFDDWLDEWTENLRRRLPKKRKDKDRLWGVARKALNLFLRSCLYNHYLRAKYRLDRIEALLEIPLDSKVAAQLRKKDKKGELPRWPGLKGLVAKDSRKFQKEAAELMGKMKLPALVFLDNFLWLAK